MLTLGQLEQFFLSQQVRQPDWFVKNDVTGRVRLIHEKKRMHRAFVVLKIPESDLGRTAVA